MKYFSSLALGLALSAAALPALAQMSPGGGMGGGMSGSPGGGPAPTPQVRTPDIAPPALPGAGLPPPVMTGPVLQKPPSTNPTADLFAAIGKGDADAAQNALGRGADLNAQDQFGETPLDLSIALNRTSITFLLLQTRNELAAQGGTAEPLGAPWPLHQTVPNSAAPPAAAPAYTPAQPSRVSLPDDAGTANPQAGFLGFGPKN